MPNKSAANRSRASTAYGSLTLLSFLLGGLFLSNQLVARSPVASPVIEPMVTSPITARQQDALEDPSPEPYLKLISRSPKVVDRALATILKNWHPGSAAMVLEAGRFSLSQSTRARIFAVLELKTGQRLGVDFDAWHQWIWRQKYQPHPSYAKFKSKLYSSIDRRFGEYFVNTDNSTIRLDEIRWGGVQRDGIPPLKNPKMLSAGDASYLNDSDVVFGIDLNGDARCYPKRILAWHEMFKDTIGGESVCGVY